MAYSAFVEAVRLILPVDEAQLALLETAIATAVEAALEERLAAIETDVADHEDRITDLETP